MSDEYISINTHFEVQSGFAFPSTSFVESGIPIVRMSDLKAGKLRFENTKHVSESWLKLSAPFILKHGDFLLGMSGSLSNHAVVTEDDEPALLNQRVGRLKQRDKNVDYEYVCYWLKSSTYARYADIQGEGAAQKNISTKQIGQFQYRDTTLEKQKKISLILNSIESTIEKTEALIHKHQQIKAGLMHDLFTRGVTADGKLRPPREQASELYQETPIGWIPKVWNVGTLGSYAEIHNNLRLPLSSEVRESMAGEFPYYGPTGILDFINEYRVNGKFVLIGEDGDHFLKFDQMEMAQLVNGKFNVNNHAHLLTGKNGCSTEWIFIYFLHRDITFWLTRQGAGRYKLNKSALEKLPLNLPKPDEQELIITRIMHFRDTEVAYFEDLEKLKKQKLGLMYDLLTGKVQVKIDQKETAHV